MKKFLLILSCSFLCFGSFAADDVFDYNSQLDDIASKLGNLRSNVQRYLPTIETLRQNQYVMAVDLGSLLDTVNDLIAPDLADIKSLVGSLPPLVSICAGNSSNTLQNVMVINQLCNDIFDELNYFENYYENIFYSVDVTRSMIYDLLAEFRWFFVQWQEYSSQVLQYLSDLLGTQNTIISILRGLADPTFPDYGGYTINVQIDDATIDLWYSRMLSALATLNVTFPDYYSSYLNYIQGTMTSWGQFGGWAYEVQYFSDSYYTPRSYTKVLYPNSGTRPFATNLNQVARSGEGQVRVRSWFDLVQRQLDDLSVIAGQVTVNQGALADILVDIKSLIGSTNINEYGDFLDDQNVISDPSSYIATFSNRLHFTEYSFEMGEYEFPNITYVNSCPSEIDLSGLGFEYGVVDISGFTTFFTVCRNVVKVGYCLLLVLLLKWIVFAFSRPFSWVWKSLNAWLNTLNQ